MSTKRFFNFMMVLMMFVTSFAVSQPAAAAPEGNRLKFVPPQLDAPRVEGEIVVQMADTENKSLPAVVAEVFATAAENDAQVTRLAADGSMVLEVGDGQIAAKLDELNNDPDVLFAEPNYTFSLPETASADDGGYRINSEYVTRSVQRTAESNWSDSKLVSIADLQSMKTLNGSQIMATYPNDAGLYQNYGWSVVGADIVWPNTTASAGVCVVDTGVDTQHPDLANRLLTGYDFVWGDVIPQDDNGHGTHVTGIIVANQNNKIGIAGASTGKVVPVKVLDAQGIGTNYDIAKGIKYCAGRTDIKVINLSLGGANPSNSLQTEIDYAVNTKNKLIVAAAGNNGNSTPTYPAGYSTMFPNKVIAVAASGKTVNSTSVDYNIPYPATNYGSWVSVVAPGGSIYSTTPYDKSFYLNVYAGLETRYGTLSGTSMAAPFVSAAAARYWGYKPSLTNAVVGADLQSSSKGNVVETGVNKWDGSMSGKVQVNIAKLLDRGALEAGVIDAANGTPLAGATIYAYQGGVSRGTAIVPALTYTDIINLPVTGGPYTLKVNKAGYTAAVSEAFKHESALSLTAGTWTTFTDTAVPPKSADFTLVLVWKVWKPNGLKEIDALRGLDLDMDIWLPAPTLSNGVPSSFVVGNEGDSYTSAVADPYGTMTFFPYSRVLREGGYYDNTAVETLGIRNRFSANGSIATNVALPYYADVYSIYVTDYGQTIDHDNDGCGDNYGTQPGLAYDSSYDPTADPDCPPNDISGTLGIPIMGTYLTPYIYVWKDGLLKWFSDGSNTGSYWPPETVVPPGTDACNAHWWKGLAISSATAGATAPQYFDNFTSTPVYGECDKGTAGYWPYLNLPEPGRSSTD